MDPPLNEPAFFYLDFQRERPRGEPEPSAHTISPAEITDVTIGIPGLGPRSTAARAVEAAGVLSFSASSEYHLSLTFDGAIAGKTADLRPGLPLVMHW
jgi:hypothetical protein